MGVCFWAGFGAHFGTGFGVILWLVFDEFPCSFLLYFDVISVVILGSFLGTTWAFTCSSSLQSSSLKSQPNPMSSYDVNLRLANDPDRKSFRSLDHFRLGSFAWDISLGNIRLWTFAWKLSFDNFRLHAWLVNTYQFWSKPTNYIYNEIWFNCLI